MGEYNFDEHYETKSFSIDIDSKAEYGYFEHDQLGDEFGGGLWFEGKRLIDYDGVFELPQQVIKELEANGYSMEYAKDEYDSNTRVPFLYRTKYQTIYH